MKWAGAIGVSFLLLGCGGRGGEKGRVPTIPPEAGKVEPLGPGSIGLDCRASIQGHPSYRTTVTGSELEVCAVGGDGALTLAVKGKERDVVNLRIARYDGPGTYPLMGLSSFTLENRLTSAGHSQSSRDCPAAAGCEVVVTSTSPDAPASAVHGLGFAVTCPKLCDSGLWVCTTSSLTPATWSFHADCSVR